ncbi:hypothetical protein [Oceanisphaera ostreae]|uniref:KfrA N-terminal DNA-binding domain-containing protein n=1 Tax=Oceanisphaera ostreae TaxID=914151 RepID=A0ABW3KER1_9GAMM
MTGIGRKKSYTEQDIVEAVQVLLDNGKAINANSLCVTIGRGRPDNIYADYQKMVENGMLQLADKQQDTALVEKSIETKPLPQKVIDKISDMKNELEVMIRLCNDEAYYTQEQRVTSEIKKSRHEVEIAQLAVQEADSDLYNTLLKLEVSEEKYEVLTEQLTEAQDELKQAKEELSEITKIRDKILKDKEILNIYRAEGARIVTEIQAQLKLKKQEVVDSSAVNAQLAEKLAKREQALEYSTAQYQGIAEELDKIKLHASKQVSAAQELRDTVTGLTVENRQVEVMRKQLDAAHKKNEELNKNLTLFFKNQQQPVREKEEGNAAIA